VSRLQSANNLMGQLIVGLAVLLIATCALGQRVIDPGRLAPIGQQVPLPPPPTGPLLPGVNLEECVLHRTTPFDPRWNLVTSSSLRGLWQATADRPQGLNFDAAGILRLELTRPSKTYGGSALVVIRQRRQSESAHSELCRVAVPMLNSASWAVITRRISDSEPINIQVDVFDQGTGGPTLDPPYTIQVTAMTSEKPLRSVQQRTSPLEPPLPDCETVDRPKRPSAALELVQSVSFDGKHRHWRYLDYIEAGRNLYVRLSPKTVSEGRTAFVINAFAKNAGRDAFKPICRLTLDSTREVKRLILAARPDSDDYLFNPIWRLEVRPQKQNGELLSETAATIEVFREKDPESLYSLTAGAEAVTSIGSMAFLCIPPPSRFATRITAQGFPTTQVVEVDTDVDPSLLLPGTIQTLESYVVQAAGLWRESCQQCQMDSLLLLKVNGKMYWPDSAVRIAPPTETDPADLGAIFVGRGGTATYLNPASTEAVKQEVCSVKYAASSPRLQSLQRSFGCKGAPTETMAGKVTMRLQPKPSTCGDDPNIVACESSGRLIELNARDYTFREFGFGRQVAKGGPRSIDLFHVILHEMGHWIGLDHQDIPGSLMAPQYSTSRCIDGETAAKIGDAPSNRTVTGRSFVYERGADEE